MVARAVESGYSMDSVSPGRDGESRTVLPRVLASGYAPSGRAGLWLPSKKIWTRGDPGANEALAGQSRGEEQEVHD